MLYLINLTGFFTESHARCWMLLTEQVHFLIITYPGIYMYKILTIRFLLSESTVDSGARRELKNCSVFTERPHISLFV